MQDRTEARVSGLGVSFLPIPWSTMGMPHKEVEPDVEENETLPRTASDESADAEPLIREDGTIECQYSGCASILKNRKSYITHRRKNHGPVRFCVKCPGPESSNNGCGLSYPSVKQLTDHIASDHGVKIEKKELHFKSEADFKRWLDDYEQATKSHFVRGGSIRERGNGETLRYMKCNRRGTKSPWTRKPREKTRKSAPWRKGTSKIGAYCPATLKIRQYADTSMQVTATLTHFGHARDLAYVPVPAKVQEEIESLLLAGERPMDIPCRLRETSQRDPDRRGYYVEATDCRTLGRKIGVFGKNAKQSALAATSKVDRVVEWLKRGKNGECSPVFYYKPATEDGGVVIGIQTESMREAMEKYGDDAVCLETVEHSIECDAKILIGTVLVIGAADEGQPGAFFIIESERCEAELLPLFVQLRERHPNLRPRFLMTDATSTFWDSWRTAFDSADTRLVFATRHLLRIWNGQVQTLIKEESLRKYVRDALQVLVDSPNEAEFERNYNLLMEELFQANPSSSFGEYFIRLYPIAKGTEWAQFGRVGCILTPMHLKSLHHVMKQKFLSRVSDQPIDRLVHVLIQDVAAHFSYVEKRAATMRTRPSQRQLLINKHHENAVHLVSQSDSIAQISADQYIVKDDGEQYIVRRIGCFRNACLVRCNSCNVCAHELSCDCPESRAGSAACAHVHVVKMTTDDGGPYASEQRQEAEQAAAVEPILVDDNGYECSSSQEIDGLYTAESDMEANQIPCSSSTLEDSSPQLRHHLQSMRSKFETVLAIMTRLCEMEATLSEAHLVSLLQRSKAVCSSVDQLDQIARRTERDIRYWDRKSSLNTQKRNVRESSSSVSPKKQKSCTNDESMAQLPQPIYNRPCSPSFMLFKSPTKSQRSQACSMAEVKPTTQSTVRLKNLCANVQESRRYDRTCSVCRKKFAGRSRKISCSVCGAVFHSLSCKHECASIEVVI